MCFFLLRHEQRIFLSKLFITEIVTCHLCMNGFTNDLDRNMLCSCFKNEAQWL